MTITGAFEAEYYCRACNWIGDKKDCFKGEVLDICCGNGILTCFIAMQHPECQIIYVDCVANSINIARQIADKLHISNVRFEQSSVVDIVDKKKYDTIFSSLTAVENLTHRVKEPQEDGYVRTMRKGSLG